MIGTAQTRTAAVNPGISPKITVTNGSKGSPERGGTYTTSDYELELKLPSSGFATGTRAQGSLSKIIEKPSSKGEEVDDITADLHGLDIQQISIKKSDFNKPKPIPFSSK